jgi:crotonobetainyl-CoA:carnitine CoA-transferase CaiB-like acyl-CoA transferase
MKPLEGYRVSVSAASDSAAVLAGELLAELGADVSSTSDPTSVDVVLLDRVALAGAVEEHRLMSEKAGGPIVVVISPFGLSGPLAAAPASELIVQALAGVLAANGYADDPPVQVGVPVGRTSAAILATAAVLAALFERTRSGRGQLVDIGEYDCVMNLLGTLLPTYFLTGREFDRIGNRHPMCAPWNAYPTADGWVVISTMGESQWRNVLTLIGRLDAASDPRFLNADLRVKNVAAVDEMLEAWTSTRPTQLVQQELTAVDIPVAPIRSVTEALADEQATARELVGVLGGVLQPGPLFRISEPKSNTQLGRLEPSQEVFVPHIPHGSEAISRPRVAPLEGIRVIEVGAYTAGPLAGRLLGQLGADVIKLEPPRGEGSRHLAQRLGDTGYLYFVNNTDKSGVQLALDTAEGAEQFRRLLIGSDVFLTNLAADTLQALHLDPDSVALVNPRVIYTSVTGYGLTGPSASRRAFDTVVQASSGIMSLTGFASQPPLKAALSVADIFSAFTATAATLAALVRRERDGCGQLVDTAMFDAAMWLSVPRWPHRQDDPPPMRRGNRDAVSCPHDVYRTLDDRWIALSVGTSEQWNALCNLLGDDVPASLRAASASDRQSMVDEIDALVLRWTATRSAEAAVAQLRAAGVPAAVPNLLGDVVNHPQTKARELILTQDDDFHGQLHVIGSPFRFSATPVGVRRRAPHLGEHNAQYLGQL